MLHRHSTGVHRRKRKCRNSSRLLRSSSSSPAIAHAEIYNFIFQGPATCSINGGAGLSGPIQLNAGGDLANPSTAGSGPGFMVETVPLENLSVSGSGISGGSIRVYPHARPIPAGECESGAMGAA